MKGLKCPQCSIVQFKGKICSIDGSILIISNETSTNLQPIEDQLIEMSDPEAIVREILDKCIEDVLNNCFENFSEEPMDEDTCENSNDVLSELDLKKITDNFYQHLERNPDKPTHDFQICILNVIVPFEYFKHSNNSTLEICFLTDKTYDIVRLFYETQFELIKNRNLINFRISVYVPYNLAEIDQKLVYFYYLNEFFEQQNMISKYPEINFINKKRVRRLDTGNNEYSQNHLDGHACFDHKYVKSVNLKSLKEEVILKSLENPIKILWDTTIIQNQNHTFLINGLIKINESLCLFDHDYKILFHKALVKEFRDRVYKLKTIKRRDDSNYLTALTIFFCSYKFSLDLFKDNGFMQNLARSLDISDINYLNTISTNFFREHLEVLNEACDNFLKTNEEKFHLLEAIYILNIYYCTNCKLDEHKKNNQKDMPKTKEEKLNDMMQFSIGDKIINNFESYSWLFKTLLNDDTNCGILFLNYFCYRSEKNLTTLCNTYKFQSQILLNYLLFLLNNHINNEEFNFNDHDRKIFDKILSTLLKRSKDRLHHLYKNDQQQNQTIYEKFILNFDLLKRLLERLIYNGRKETDLIINAFNLFVIDFKFIEYQPDFYKRFNKRQSVLNEELDYLLNSINQWLNIECNRSILVNYGLEAFPVNKNPNQKFKRQTSTRLELLSAKNSKTNEGFYKMEDNYVSTNIEGTLYDKLLGMEIPVDITDRNSGFQLDENYFTEQILNMLNQRLNISQFEHVLKVRSKFDFNALKNKNLIEQVFNDVIINNVVKSHKLVDALCTNLNTNSDLLQFYISKVLETEWPKNKDLFHIALEFNLFYILIEKSISNYQNNIKTPLNATWSEKFQKVSNNFLETVKALAKGELETFKIRLFNNYLDKSLKLSKLVIPKEFADNLKNLITIRLRELKKFEELKTSLIAFMQFCSQNKKFDSTTYKTILQDLSKRDFNQTNLIQLCQPISFDQIKKLDANNLNSIQLNITYFPRLGNNELAKMNRIINLDRLKCVLFDFYFNQTCDEQNVPKLELNHILEQVLPNTWNKWESLAKKIDSGELKLIEIDDLLSVHFSNKSDRLLQELFYIIENIFKINNLKQRKNQLELYFKFKSSISSAQIIEKIRQAYNIENKFPELDLLLNIDVNQFKLWNLLRMDANLEKVIRVLDKYSTEDNIKCLNAFLDSIELVQWIRKNVKDLKELKFLVDLVSISKSSEYSHNSSKDVFAKTLKEACTGYKPLIFDLTEKVDFTKFIKLCDDVWINLQNDLKIPNKLIAVKDQSAFLEDVKFKKGNVELSSINQAKQFNEKGIYKIGSSIQNNCLDQSKNLSISDLIELEIELEIENIVDFDNGVRTVKIEKNKTKFSFEKLLELKSILMLVAKKSSTDVNESGIDNEDSETLDYFIEIFDNVVRLADIYLKLMNVGCDLFENFLVLVYCDSSNVLLNSDQKLIEVWFNFQKIEHKIENRKENSLKSLKDLCTQMEDSYVVWCEHLEKIRSEFDFINLFTIKQISLLRNYLNQILNDRIIINSNFEQIKALLFNIRQDLRQDTFIDLLNDVFNESMNKQKNIRREKSTKKNSKLGEFINELALKNNFSIKIVREAIDKYGTSNEDDLINYCMENDLIGYDDNNQMDFEEDNEQMEIDSNLDTNNLKFSKKIELLFQDFMNKQNSCIGNLFTLELFAIFLEVLNSHNNNRLVIKRKIPGYLINRGRPNLIMCSNQSDQINIVLSIYAHSSDSPLPSNDEVLFCNSGTTSEEVENFFRIAFKSTSEKIYTLLNIQELSYETSIKIEKFLSTNTNLKHTDNFVLACLCCTDKQEQSIIASSLIKNKVNPIMINPTIIEEYLNLKLKSNDEKDSLSANDPNRSSIRALLSRRAGNGKSAFVENFKSSILRFDSNYDYKIIRIKTNTLNIDNELKKLFDHKKSNRNNKPTLYHIDIAKEVFSNVDLFIFNLAILSYLKHSNGHVWRRSTKDLYFIEMMPPYIKSIRPISYHSILNFIPRIEFRTPSQYLFDLKNSDNESQMRQHDILFKKFYLDKKFQRSAIYLKVIRDDVDQLDSFSYNQNNQFTEAECLSILLEYSQLRNPNWADLYNFVNFLDDQLNVLENANVINQVPYLRGICARFIVMMAHDFGIPSLNLGDGTDVMNVSSDNRVEIQLDKLEIARHWENMTHPYIIFNADKQSFTFMGIFLDRRTYKFINPNTNEEINTDLVINAQMRIELLKQRIPIYDNFNEFPRTKKINSLRIVMGLDASGLLNHDPDPTYELTLDNCLKIMAIFMRLRCNNPVVIMGETGCGKTRKLKFYSDLHINPKLKNVSIKHLIHFKIHGGTTYEEIERKVEEAERLSRLNLRKLYDDNYLANRDLKDIPATAILFFDEANTTEAIGLIKEIMCDLTCNGRPIDIKNGLKIVAAVNPYKKHSDAMIKKLEEAGLGFYVSANDSKEKLGHIPMRQLVYRVQPLPASMLPLVWDFGQLNLNTENVYINQMIIKASNKGVLPKIEENELKILSHLLTQSQNFMRSRNDECSFVSLRDVERVIKVTSWFLNKENLILRKMKEIKLDNCPNDNYQNFLSNLRRAFILALAVCYHSSLHNSETRFKYRELINNKMPLDSNFKFSKQNDWVLFEILKCQHVFLDEIHLNNNIARNSALLENVFMIIVCLELRIPLFIVGKPGSSKSLAKSIVESSMNGQNSKSELFKNLKETYFVNFQCSPLTKPEMIIKAFQEAASFQENNDLDKSVAVVNLDEVGLAEASESMPLKTLHPLLEDGSDSSDDAALPHQKVGVIGISNWALDPAKMNRGIFVSRGEPDINELVESAKGICKYDQHIYNSIQPFIKEIAEAYLEVCSLAKQHKREFFGLRDFYSLIKMVYWFCTKDGNLTWHKLEHSVKRNFSGLDLDTIEPFHRLLFTKLDSRRLETDPKCGPIDLIKSALKGENVESNSRYLLLLTENYSVIDMVQSYLIKGLKVPAHKVVVIFGSSFRHDLEYTEVCKNISKIKHSMEIGNTVILLNFQNLYESLYDALNQYYNNFGDQRYVYLGLNTHRVNCVVHENFRLIIISDKESVYDSKRFPIPLINRLEKHFLNASTLLNKTQLELCDKLKNWLDKFLGSGPGQNSQKPKLNDLFIGYHDDALASIILYLTEGTFNFINDDDDDISDEQNSMLLDTNDSTSESVFGEAKKILLRCATADTIVRLSSIKLQNIDDQQLWDEYFKKQSHLNLIEMLKTHINQNEKNINFNKNLLQITTHSKISLTKSSLASVATSLNIQDSDYSSCILQSFETQKQFSDIVKSFLSNESSSSKNFKLLIIQCDFSKKFDSELLSCTRHTIVETLKEISSINKDNLGNNFILLLINLPREFSKKFVGFQIGHWSCYHIDELDESLDYLPSLESIKSKRLSDILKDGLYKQGSEAINLKALFQKLAHHSCSLIRDTNIKRTIQRVSLLIKLCENEEFLRTICSRIIKLQEDKESDYISSDIAKNWLSKEVANLKQINEFSTLKRSCQNYIESKLSPLLAFVLAKIDYHSNLDIFFEPGSLTEWKSNLFLDVFKSFEFLKLNYYEMRSSDSNKNEELKEFYCKSERFEKKFLTTDEHKLKPCLPFFWILVNHLNEFCQNYVESISSQMDQDQRLDNYIRTIPDLFKNTIFYEIINFNVQNLTKSKPSLNIYEMYLNDFILVNCNVRIEEEVNVIKKAIKSSLSKGIMIDERDLKISLPLVHLEYENLKSKIDIYLKFSSLYNNINEKIFKLSEFSNIDLDACLASIEQYERQTQKTDLSSSVENLNQLLKMVRDVCISSKSKSPKLKIISNKYNSLKFLNLFLENVCQNDNNLKLKSEFPDLINMIKIRLIKDSIDFKSKVGIEFIHDFLVKCVRKIRQFLFNQFKVSQCCKKECIIYKKLNTNNCNCLVCADCELVMKSRMVNNSKVFCLSCKKEISVRVIDNKISIELSEMPDRKNLFEKFVETLNSFYLNINELLVFEDEIGPEENAIKAILKVVTDGVIFGDHSVLTILPLFRSLLIQIIFKNYAMVPDYLNTWFRKTDSVSQSNLFKSSFDMALFFQNCVQDSYDDKTLEKNIDNEIIIAHNVCKELLDNKGYLYNRILINQSSRFAVESLAYLAKLKFCLKILAKITNSQETIDSINNKKLFDLFTSDIRNLIEPTMNQTNTIYNYLIKEIIRKYSYSSVKYILGNESINWIMPKSIIGDNLDVSDRYILIGEKYLSIKTSISECFQNRNSVSLEKVLGNDKDRLFPYLIMGIYKNVTTLFKDVENVPIDLFKPALEKLYPHLKNHWQTYLENVLTHNLKINKTNWNTIELNLLLVQIKYSILYSRSNLVKPFSTLINSPKNHKNSYLPCMPQDSLFDIHNAIRQGNSGDNPKFYACPNGHPYVLFDCGRPWVVFNCKTCNEQIGGTGHNLLPTNREINVQDNTLRGYCLPVPSSLNDNPANERLINAPSFHILRFFLNACMYFACDTNETDVMSIMTVNPLDRKQFFWDYLNKDLRIASKALNLNMDEMIIFLHDICEDILKHHTFANISNERWSSKDDRQAYEKQFFDTFLANKLREPGNIISQATKKLKEEDKQDHESKKLYFMAYELLSEDKSKESFLYEKFDFWKYQPTCDFNVFKIELNNRTNSHDYALLKKFIEKETCLKLMKNLPYIMTFVSHFQKNHFKQFFKHFASNTSLRDSFSQNFFSKSITKEKLDSIVKAFQDVWFNCKQQIKNFIRENISSMANFNFDYDYEFNMDSKLTCFLPTLNGDGLICYALIRYLIEIQNEILLTFKPKVDQHEIVDVALVLDKEYIISFDTNDDLLRIIKSNFIFDSKESKFWFRYDNITNLIIERYFQTKPLINHKTIPIFEYSDEINDFTILNKLNETIHQEIIDTTLQSTIFNDFKTINQTAEALNVLKIVINYAKTTSSKPDEFISDFMKKIYIETSVRNSDSNLKSNIIEQCQLKHLKNLWILLMMKRAFLYTINSLNPFENLDQIFKDPTEVDLTVTLDPLMTLSLSLVIYQLITFYSNNLTEEDYHIVSNNKMTDFFYDLDGLNIISPVEADKLVDFIPHEIKMKNIFKIWLKLTDSIKKFD